MSAISEISRSKGIDRNALFRMRSVLILIMIVYPAWYYVVDIALDYYTDSLIERLLISSVSAVSLALSYRSPWVRRNLEWFLLVSCLSVILHLIYLSNLNHLNYVYVFGTFLAFFVLGIAFETLPPLLCSLFIPLIVATLVSNEGTEVHKVLFLAVFFTAGLFSLLTSWTRMQHAKLLRRKSADLEAANEALQDALKARTALFANVSHELRTPLTLILGHCESIKNSELIDLTLHNRLDTIERNALILINQVGNILEIAKSDSGQETLRLESFDAANLMRAHAESFSNHALAKTIAFVIDIPESLPVVLDSEKFEGIFVNLLSNAIKYTPSPGKVNVRVRSKARSLQIIVEDSGPGIPAELRSKIFERFFRIDDSAHHIGGTGLGLAIVRQFAYQMQGSVEVDTSVFGGARFIVNLPVSLAETAPERNGEIKLAQPSVSPLLVRKDDTSDLQQNNFPKTEDKFSVLFVEDHPELLNFLITTFENEFNVLGASNGEKALDCLAANHVDVICSDVMMPVMNGEELFEQTRNDPNFASIPFIFLTARDDAAMREALLRKGAQDFIAKPVNRDVLRSRILSKLYLRRQNILALEAINRQLIEARDRALEASAAKSLFLANVSHELRTPLTAISGFTEVLLSDSNLAETQTDYLQRIERNSKILTDIIDDLLLVTKIETGHFEIKKGEFPIGRLIEDLTTAAKTEAPNTKLNVQLSAGIDEKLVILSDYTRMFQVVANLVKNAVKFSSGKDVELLIKIDPILSEQTTKLTCEVTDRGIGISQEDQERLFQPFGKADSSLSRQFGGTGLGLHLAKKIARALDGNVWIKSTKRHHGSTFVAEFQIELPQIKSISKNQVGANSKNLLSGYSGIVVEDSVDQQFLLEKFLRQYGASVRIAANGQEGVELVTQCLCDFVVMDVQMPILDGIEATKRLRSMGYDKPIIVLTAHGLQYEEKLCLNAGADRYLTKPIGKETLATTVKTVLDAHAR